MEPAAQPLTGHQVACSKKANNGMLSLCGGPDGRSLPPHDQRPQLQHTCSALMPLAALQRLIREGPLGSCWYSLLKSASPCRPPGL